jgi:hypothetical protein
MFQFDDVFFFGLSDHFFIEDIEKKQFVYLHDHRLMTEHIDRMVVLSIYKGVLIFGRCVNPYMCTIYCYNTWKLSNFIKIHS